MHVLITGGAGFIGSHTVEALLKGGATVRVLDNLSAGKRQNLQDHKKLELQIGDIRNIRDVLRPCKGSRMSCIWRLRFRFKPRWKTHPLPAHKTFQAS